MYLNGAVVGSAESGASDKICLACCFQFGVVSQGIPSLKVVSINVPPEYPCAVTEPL
ncbi:hypothetical protein SAMN04489759_103245 [Sulfitobacter delicatus]|uniref:Uncharacterized protein n=1 Tax=Sulfitobacter delicatus TaxID=218672 RepID=A0A1G7P9H4_9RHOB|nr:hypothetical protein SAMN04489759_103245 [Sulfitobacter delicatus]